MIADNDNELPRSRAAAKAVGATYYFDGKICKHGHIAKRLTSSGGCHECKRQRGIEWNAANAEWVKEYNRRWYAENTDKAKEKSRKQREEEDPKARKEYKRKWAAENREKVLESRQRRKDRHPTAERDRSRKRRAENPDGVREYQRNWTANNPESTTASRIKWRKANPDTVKANARRHYAKNKDDPGFKLENAVRSSVMRGLKEGSKAVRRTFEILGYTLDELRSHIEKQFQPGMSWDNYGIGENCWQVDHIIPLAVHNYQTPDDIDFKRAWALSNLQPLWDLDNKRKSAKLDKPFQPSLALAA